MQFLRGQMVVCVEDLDEDDWRGHGDPVVGEVYQILDMHEDGWLWLVLDTAPGYEFDAGMFRPVEDSPLPARAGFCSVE